MCIIVTYRCPMQCQMCNIWKNPTQKEKEITLAEIKKLPSVKFINITGGEPFVREDLEEIIEICFQKSPRVVISTSGWFEDRIIKMTKRFPNIGIRISIEGLSLKNDELRGRNGGFDKGLRTLLRLWELKILDLELLFLITIQLTCYHFINFPNHWGWNLQQQHSTILIISIKKITI